jgi:hypothetical protein
MSSILVKNFLTFFMLNWCPWTSTHIYLNEMFIFYFLYPFLLYRTLTMSRIFIFLWIYTQSVGLLGRVIGSSQGLYLNTGQQEHRKTHTHTPNIHALSGIRTHDHGLRASEDSSCLRPLGYCDRLASERAKTVHALDRSATVTY